MTALPLPAKPGWPSVTRYEVTERLLGGDGGPLNRAPAELLERTEFLKKQIDDIVSGALTAEYADRLKTPRNIAMTGDGSWSVTFDAGGNVSGALTLANTPVTPGTWAMTTVDAKGRVTAGRALAAYDVPSLDWTKITSGKPTTLGGYGITDAASKTDLQTAVNNLVAGAPGALDTLQELAAALGNDQNFAGTIANTLSNKADKADLANAGLLGFAKNITQGSCLEFRPNGLYHVADLVKDRPIASNGMLAVNFLVPGWGSIAYQSWGGATFEARVENGIWQPWVKVLKSGQQSTLASYGITDAASKTDLQTAVNNLVAGAPGALDTLQELAAALGNDQNFAGSIAKALSNKADRATTLAGYGIADAMPLRPNLGDKADLNSITGTGIYHQRANAQAVSGANYPVGVAGMLFVYASDGMVYQTYQAYDNTGFYYRAQYNGRWSAWKRLADDATTLAGYGIADAVPLDGAGRASAQSFRAAKGLPMNDSAAVGFAFGPDGDTGMFADYSGSNPNTGSKTINLRVDSKDVLVADVTGGLWAQGYGWLHDKFALSSNPVLKGVTKIERLAPDTIITAQGGDEGGQLNFERSVNSSLNGDVAIDIWRNCLRIFETGGENRGIAIDLSSLPARIGTRLATTDDVASAAPPGQIAFFARDAAPAGWLKCDGAQNVSRVAYAALFAAIGDRFGVGDGKTTFGIPDLRGEFVRGWSAGRTDADSGRAFGSLQMDAIRNITGSLSASGTCFDGASGAIALADTQSGSVANSATQNGRTDDFIFDASRVVPVSNEVRPRNIAMLACIKI
ncbi:tail fiber protein [Chromobacterium sp. IIBBL 290-4]|uniref:tail fiber protein n=1 Tax=Chromobacterium sp. IIBBL 290-4 TaxID=2953890 RepID=UPI0020B8E269|nr:tail fiber protein [Chromobacterium sp. IIBBL 290-4]UTH73341.1 tail fiber protein [Chromobacterium sp. IIBBL 290-4]